MTNKVYSDNYGKEKCVCGGGGRRGEGGELKTSGKFFMFLFLHFKITISLLPKLY